MTPDRIIQAGLQSPNLSNIEYNRLVNINIYNSDQYGEPGYSTNKEYIVVGNFNPSDFKNPGQFGRTLDLLEKIAELEWLDEWITCDDCGKLYRCSPDSYSWLQSYHKFECGNYVCKDCIDPEEFLGDIQDNPRKAITLDIDPEDFGFESYNGVFESGFHPGQTDDPSKIAKEVEAKGFNHYVFKIDSVGQFDCRFKVYVK